MPLLGAILILGSACSPTDVERSPLLGGPDRVHGQWANFMIVCTIPLTLSTPYPIRIVEGDIRATFPAEGTVVAQVTHELNGQELEDLWGGDWEGAVTRSLRIEPTVQNLDYEVVLEFVYSGTDPDRPRTGLLEHRVFCLAPAGQEPQPGPGAVEVPDPEAPDLNLILPTQATPPPPQPAPRQGGPPAP